MKIRHKKMLSLLLVVAMLAALFPAAALAASSPAGTVSGAVYSAAVEEDAITSFAPITLSAGTVSGAVYADADAVIEALMTQFSSVTALTADESEVSVPVAAWTDTDGYNPEQTGSYTFTATLGELPAGYMLGEGVTATAEVVVAAGGSLAPGVYSVPLAFYNGFYKYEENSIYTAAVQRIQFNHRALVTAQADGSYQVKLKVESYSLLDFIQIVDPVQAGQVKSLSEAFYEVLPGTFNCPEAYLQDLLDKGRISADTNGYYLQGDVVRLEAADLALDTGYVTFAVPNLEEDLLLKTYSNPNQSRHVVPQHPIMRFSPEQAVPLPESLMYGPGSRTMGYAWTNYVYGDITNAERNVDGRCLQFLDGLFEEAVEVAVDENGKMAAIFTLKENQQDPVVSIEVASNRGPYEDYQHKLYLLNEGACTTYDQVDIIDGKITLDFDDMAFGRSMRIMTESAKAYNDALESDPYKELNERYYFGCLRLEPEASGGDEDLVLESNGVRLITTTNSIPANSVFTAQVGRHVPQYLGESTFNNIRNFSKDGESYLVYDTSLTSGGEAVRPIYEVALEIPIPEAFDLNTLTVVQARDNGRTSIASLFCTIDGENRVVRVETNDPLELNASYVLLDRGSSMDLSPLPEGLYRVRVSTAHNSHPEQASMSNAALVNNTGILEVQEDGSRQLYLDMQGVPIGALFGYMSGMNYYEGDDQSIKKPVISLSYQADGGNLQIDAIASECRLHYLKRLFFPLTVPNSDNSYQVSFIVPIMDGLGGGTPGDGTAEATARLRITMVEEVTDGVNPLTGYDKTVLKAKMNEAQWLLETLEDEAAKTALQNAVNTAQATYDSNPDSDTVLAATQTLAEAVQAAQEGGTGALADGAYDIPAQFHKSPGSVSGSTNPMLASAELEVTDGAIKAILHVVEAETLTGSDYINKLQFESVYDSGEYTYAAIEETDAGGKPSKISFMLPEEREYTRLKLERGGGLTSSVYLFLDFANATLKEPSRLEAPIISSAYDEQNNSYTVTISTATAGAVKYRLSGSESGTGQWLDYTEPFVVDSTNELINQGLLYVLAYVASTEAGVADSETALALLDFRGGSEPGPIEDGAYTLPVSLWHAANDQPSMGNNALEQTAGLVVEDGQGTLYLTFKSLEFMGMTGYLSELNLLDNIVFNENNYPVDYDLIPATVISTYDVVDQFNGPDSTDPRCKDKPYPKDLSIPVVLEQEYTWVHVYVPVMGSMGFGDQVARIKLDWSNLVAEEPEDIEITVFDPIEIAAGSAGSATYADAAAVIEYLNTNHASVTAQAYGGGTVSVPVTGWTDTDAYDPDTAGSYTFTATLGELPAGYILGEGVTATAEVVVAQAGGEGIEDGAYTLPVSLWHAANDQPSMGNNALEQTAGLVVEDGQGRLYLTFKSLTFMGMEGYLSQLDLLDNIVFNENNYPVAYDLIPATVLSTYDVWDQFNDPETGTDPNCTGIPYPKDLSIPVVLGQEYTWVHVYVPVMGSLGFGDQVARIKLDWSSLVAEEPEDVEITAFDPIEIAAGSAGSATYADAAAVIEYLNTNHASVTAQAYGGGTVSVPVTGWTDTDAYDPDTAGSYTFTATLGQLPEGYANPNNLTATAEVVVAESAPVVDKTALTEKLSEAQAIEQGNYTQESYAALQNAITAAEAVLADEDATQGEVDEAVLLLQNAIAALTVEGEDGAYTLTPVPDETYQAGTTPHGILTMTVNDGFSGLKYFGVQVTPVREHSGKEAVVFTHQRDDGAQLSLNVTRADFDLVQEAQAGFNVQAGDVITVYIVDDLTNDPDTNPIILQ